MAWVAEDWRSRRSSCFAGRGMLVRTGMLPVGLALLAVCLLGALGGSAAVSDADNGSPVASGPAKTGASFQERAEEAVICPDDLLFIHVFDVEQITREYRVSSTGMLTLPLLPEPVKAAGLTTTRLAQVISQKFRDAGVLTNAQVTVTIRESRVHSVVIAGAVKRPQIYPVFGRTTLLDLLSQAEGIADDAGSMATITRGEVAMRVLGSQGGENTLGSEPVVPRTVTVNLKRLLDTGDPSLNLDIYPGDRVTVPRAGIVYVVGAVNRSGGYTLTSEREEMTVLKALALAEDVKSTAKKKKAMIIRKNPSLPSGREEIKVDLEAILAGAAPDRALQVNDILFVPDSSSKKALRRAAEAAVQAATLVVVYRR